MRAAFGLRVHSGWAAFVAICGYPRSVEVVARRRIICIETTTAGARQPYHFVEEMELAAAEDHLTRCRQISERLALSELEDALASIRASGHQPAGAAILEASGRPLPSLSAILASHALIHTAEGEFFRGIFHRACENFHLSVIRIRERELATAPTPLRETINNLGRTIGPPWTQDQKLAALAACRVLSTKAAANSPAL